MKYFINSINKEQEKHESGGYEYHGSCSCQVNLTDRKEHQRKY